MKSDGREGRPTGVFMFSKKLLASAAVISFAVAGAASAQETTSAVRGNVRSTDGTPVAGAQVTVTHGPTGAVSAEYADAAGVFDLRGLRVGGPYTIEVTADDFQGQRMENVFLEVGTPFRIALDLEPSDAEIVVTATRSGLSDSVGSGSVLSRSDIESTVSVTRDIRDLARRDPLVTQNSRGDGGISIGGSNPRTNRITIDGVQAQDDYGLNTGGLPTRRGPISIDAVRQFAVEAAPFDVENGDFIGGAINIVLREGGNDLDGSAFVNYLNEGLVGTRIQGQRIDNTTVQENWGATVRGPLWRDRLFFALSYETYESQDPTSVGPAGGGFASSIIGPSGVPNSMTLADIAAVTDVFDGDYGSTFEFGEISLTKPVTDEKYTGRFDWNITDDHLATLTFRHSESALRQRTNLSATSAGLDSQWYTTGEDDYTTALQINSRWTDSLSTEARVSFRDYTRLQAPPGGQDFSDIRVCATPGTNVGGNSASNNALLACSTPAAVSPPAVAVVRFGPDQFRHANFLHTENTQAQFSAEYQVGAHLFKAGVQYQDQLIFNLFVPNSDGTYYFDSIGDFDGSSQGTAGVTGYASELIYRNALSGNPNDAAADFSYATTSLFVQDTWDVTDRLTLNYGLRYDSYSVADDPALNPNFVTRHGRTNQVTYDGRDVIMPRFSATYDITDDMRLSGGVGLFSGGLPDVFIANVFGNTGILDNTITFQRSILNNDPVTSLATAYGFIRETSGAVNCSSAVANQYGAFSGQQVCLAALNVPINSAFGDNIPAEVQAALGGSSASPTSETNVFASNFEIPSIWKANLSFNWDFHRNLRFGADVLVLQDEQGLAFRDIRAQRLIINGVQALTPDGRIRYDGLGLTAGQRTTAGITSVNPGANRDIEAFNPDETPVSWVASVNLQGTWDNGIEAGISYARQNIDEYSNGARFSSTASSLYGSQFAAEDPNAATRGRGQEEITDSIKYNFSFRHDFVADLETRFTLLGEWRTGRPVSFTMSGGSSRNSVFGVNRGAQLAWVSNLENMTQVAGGATVTTTDDVWRTADNRMTFAGNDTVTRASGVETAGADGVLDDIARLRDALNQFGLTTGGTIARGAYENNDIHRLDLQISQELPAFRGHRTLLTFDVANVLNLLNSDWGVISEYTEDVRLFNVACADLTGGTTATGGTVSCNTYRVSSINTTQTEQRNTDLSRWAIQIGLKYEF